MNPLGGNVFLLLDTVGMPSTYLELNYHLVFSTKHREPSIHIDWKRDLHGYLGGVVKGLGGAPVNINGVNDHVHLLVGLRATHCLSDFMRELKKASSKWARCTHSDRFLWQEGYAAFTVSASMKDTISQYISKQEDHHRFRSYREELIVMLTKAGITFDPRFLD